MHLTVNGYLEACAGDHRVQRGSFAGMQMGQANSRGTLLPMLFGTYERELAQVIESVPGGGYSTIVDVGAGDGYYAVGLARTNPGIPVVAFEYDPQARRQAVELISLNGVGDQVTLLQRCTAKELQAAIDGPTFVLMDVEGEEVTLLDPDVVPALRQADILVEIHDFVSLDIADTIRERLWNTHEAREIWQQDRFFSELPRWPSRAQRLWWDVTLQRPYRRLREALSEHRPHHTRWLYLTRRDAGRHQRL